MNVGNVNWVLILVLAVLIIYALRGRREGFIRTVFGMFSFIIALGIAAVLSPQLSKAIQSNERMLPYVTEKIDTNNLTLPEKLEDSLKNHNNLKDYQEIAAEKVEELLRIQLAIFIINALSYILVFLVAFVLLRYLCNTLDIISKLPIINAFNKLAGLLAGIIRGFVTIWLWCIVLTIFSTSTLGQNIFLCINESEFLQAIYNNNIIYQFIF